MVFIKPFDEHVFETFYVFVKFIEELEKELGINIEVITQKSLHVAFLDHEDLIKKYAIKKELLHYDDLSDECKRSVTYIVTMGGDGTILYAAK